MGIGLCLKAGGNGVDMEVDVVAVALPGFVLQSQ